MDSAILLYAEDEPLILLSTHDALEAGGYAVICVSTGSEALAVLDSRIAELKGIITDIRLGGGPDGWELARHARELKPDIAVVYTSGDSAADWASQGVPKSAMVQKPYAPAQLLTAISTLLVEMDSRPG